ncbi:hypothetical protein [Streptomyces sp. NBC_00102]|uniref:hypothetical protein n=1 Tax=Streptomyces sp. NBC_00102 TaxID=2975652 RepID=UPI0022548373|nr:hypothetical protein [Streptomyces sp. NBC_00102]MCX5399606.1 hypothetical protein [Streptomyces sp. NBC_00102]
MGMFKRGRKVESAGQAGHQADLSVLLAQGEEMIEQLRAVPQSLVGARRQLRHLAALSERPHTSSMRTLLRLAMHRI